MIRVETLGMIDVAKNNPVLKLESDTENYKFITNNDIVYLVSNTPTGDDSYKDTFTIKAGQPLNCFVVKAWADQKLNIDEKHIAYAEGQSYTSIVAGTTLLTINGNGKLAIASEAPTSGIYFKVTDKFMFTEKAVKALVVVVDTDTVPETE